MISPFVGGYLFHPAALEWSGDKCSHGCMYCFANINKASRVEKISSPARQLLKKTVVTSADVLLSLGHTVCLSNRSDPFSPNNYRATLAILKQLVHRDNGVFIQTKTGPGIHETLDLWGDRDDMVWYITLTTIDPKIAARIEPRAPGPQQRMRAAEMLHGIGRLVIIALNPCVEEWMGPKDVESVISWMKSVGLRHAVVEKLDISRQREKRLSANARDAIGSGPLSQCKAHRSDAGIKYVRQTVSHLLSSGISVEKKGMPYATDFYDDIRARLGVTYPAMQDFINYCFSGQDGVVTFEEFESVLAQGEVFSREFKGNQLREYLLRMDFRLWKESDGKVKTHRDLLRLVWNDSRSPMSPQNLCLFRPVFVGGKQAMDEHGNILVHFERTPSYGPKEVIRYEDHEAVGRRLGRVNRHTGPRMVHAEKHRPCPPA